MVDRLEKEVRKLQALSDMLMHMEGEPVPKGTSDLLDDIVKGLRESIQLISQ